MWNLATVGYPAGETQFLRDMRSQYNFASTVTDDALLTYGNTVCSDRQAGQSQDAMVTCTQSAMSDTDASQSLAMARLAETGLCPKYVPPPLS